MVAAQPFLEVDAAVWRRHLDVNLTVAFISAQAAARVMVERGTPGLLLFTSSWVATRPWPGIGDAVAFLASPAAATMDGSVLLLDAGCSVGTV